MVSVNQFYGSSKVFRYLNYAPNSKNDHCTFVLNILLHIPYVAFIVIVVRLPSRVAKVVKIQGNLYRILKTTGKCQNHDFFNIFFNLLLGPRRLKRFFIQIENNNLLYTNLVTKLYMYQFWVQKCSKLASCIRQQNFQLHLFIFNEQKIKIIRKLKVS